MEKRGTRSFDPGTFRAGDIENIADPMPQRCAGPAAKGEQRIERSA